MCPEDAACADRKKAIGRDASTPSSAATRSARWRRSHGGRLVGPPETRRLFCDSAEMRVGKDMMVKEYAPSRPPTSRPPTSTRPPASMQNPRGATVACSSSGHRPPTRALADERDKTRLALSYKTLLASVMCWPS
eukprot:9080692-Pyramimonas_sp.AAC.1